MERRTLLSLVGTSLAGISGCSSLAEDTPPRSPNGNSTDNNGTSTEAGTDTAADVSIDVELHPVEYIVQTFEPSSTRGIAPDNIVPEDDIPAVLLDSLHEARDGDFETDSVSEGLLASLDEFREYDRGLLKPYVELAGTTYEFDPTFPTFVAELGDETLKDYDPDRVFRAEDWQELETEAEREFLRALTLRGTQIPRTDYRRFMLPEPVSTFLAEVDYLEDHLGVSRIETATRHSDPPHTITLRKLTDEDMWGRPVADETELDDELVAFFQDALDSDHRKPALPSPDRSAYFTDEVPGTYFDLVSGYEYPPFVRLRDTVYRIIIGRPEYDAIPVSVTTEEKDGSNRAFTLRVSPEPDKADGDIVGPFTFSSRGALPSVLWVIHGGERYLLDSPDYETDHWRDPPDDVGYEHRPSNEVLESVGTTDELAATYTLTDELPEGTYVSRGEFRVSWNFPGQTPEDGAVYPFELLITRSSS